MALTKTQLRTADRRRAQLLELCQSLPEVRVEPCGQRHLAFRVRKKTFAYYLLDHHDDGRIAFCCKSTVLEQGRLIQSDTGLFFSPPYLGIKGWIGMRIDASRVDWATVAELGRSAYQAIAPRKLADTV